MYTGSSQVSQTPQVSTIKKMNSTRMRQEIYTPTIENMIAFYDAIRKLYREIFMLKPFLALSLTILNGHLTIAANFVFVDH